MEELTPAHELLMGLETSRGWGPVHFAGSAIKWMNAFAETGNADELRVLEDAVRSALYHDKWQELGNHLHKVYDSYSYTCLFSKKGERYTDIRKKR